MLESLITSGHTFACPKSPVTLKEEVGWGLELKNGCHLWRELRSRLVLFLETLLGLGCLHSLAKHYLLFLGCFLTVAPCP